MLRLPHVRQGPKGVSCCGVESLCTKQPEMQLCLSDIMRSLPYSGSGSFHAMIASAGRSGRTETRDVQSAKVVDNKEQKPKGTGSRNPRAHGA